MTLPLSNNYNCVNLQVIKDTFLVKQFYYVVDSLFAH